MECAQLEVPRREATAARAAETDGEYESRWPSDIFQLPPTSTQAELLADPQDVLTWLNYQSRASEVGRGAPGGRVVKKNDL